MKRRVIPARIVTLVLALVKSCAEVESKVWGSVPQGPLKTIQKILEKREVVYRCERRSFTLLHLQKWMIAFGMYSLVALISF